MTQEKAQALDPGVRVMEAGAKKEGGLESVVVKEVPTRNLRTLQKV